MDPTSKTSATLLARLRQFPADEAAWNDFAERYGRKIYAWCLQWNVPESDAQDVTQIVLLKLVDKMRSFDYDPSRSFRAWLKTVTRNALSDFWSGQGRSIAVGGTHGVEMLHAVQAREELVERLDAEFDRELLEEAMSQVRQRVVPRTWRAFELTALEGHSGAQAAQELGMKVATIFVAKSKVQKLIRAELQRLDS